MNLEVVRQREALSKTAQLIMGQGLRVTQEGAGAFVQLDPRTYRPLRLNVPLLPDDAPPPLIRALQGYVDHECAHMLFTDWSIVALAAEHGVRATHNVIEDCYVERAMGDRFPGARWNLARLAEYTVARITPELLEQAGDDAIARFSCLIVPVARAMSAQAEFQRFMDKGGHWDEPLVRSLLEQLGPEVAARMPHLASSAECFDMARLWVAAAAAARDKVADGPATPAGGALSDQAGEGVGEKGRGEGGRDGPAPGEGAGVNGRDPRAAAGDGGAPIDEAGAPPSESRKAEPRDADGAGEDPGGAADAGAKAATPEEADPAGGARAAGPPNGAGAGASEGEGGSGGNGGSGAGACARGRAGQDESPAEPGTPADRGGADGTCAGGPSAAAAAEGRGRGDGGGDGAPAPPADEVDVASVGERLGRSAGESRRQREGTDAGGASDASGGADRSDGSGEDAASGRPSRPDTAEPRERATTPRDGEGEDDRGPAPGSSRTRHGERGGESGPAGGGGQAGWRSGPLSAADLAGLEGDPFLEGASRALSAEAARAVEEAPYRVFTREHDRIRPLDPHPKYQDGWLAALDGMTQSMTGVMQKHLERMMAAKSRVTNAPGFRSGRLHPAGLYRLALGDDRVFRRKVTSRAKDTAVTLLVDNSGSMRGEKLMVAMASAYALSATLERILVPHEVLGFTTGNESEDATNLIGGVRYSRTEPLVMPVFKAFSERLAPQVRQRFATMAAAQPGTLCTIEGECLELAALRLLRRSERRKVIIVINDGQPSGHHAAPAVLEAHLHRTIKVVTGAGIETVGIGILSDDVRRFYPKSIVLQALSDLPSAVMGELYALLAA